MRSRNVRPSWKQGFARNAAESAYPGLWKGLVGAWVPSLGVTGLTLRDVSGRHNHGTLTNMDPATDWVTTDQRGLPWALELDEINDHVLIPDFSYGPHFSVSFWFNPADNVGNLFQYIYSHGAFGVANSLNIYLIEAGEGVVPNQLRTYIRDTNDAVDVYLDAGTGFTSGWHYYVLTVGADGAKVYVDGVIRVSNATRGGDAFNPATNIFWGGREDLSADRFFGGQLNDLAIWSRALLPDEIASHAARPNDMFTLAPRALVGTAGAPPAGNRRRRMMLFGAGA